MTKGEVAGLQRLAEAAGGTLTRNPDTGLPEASFLERLLPTIVGLGVGFATMNPYAGAAAGAAVGGAQNKDDPLMGAVMGGLGGYGGAGIGAGFGAGAGAAGAAGSTGLTSAGAAAPSAAGTALPGASTSVLPPTDYSIAPSATAPGLSMTAAPMDAGIASLQAPAGAMTSGAPSGFSSLMSAGGLKNVAMGAAPLLMPVGYSGPSDMSEEEMKDDEDLMGRYTYERNPTGGTRPAGSAFTGERMYFEPEFRRNMAQGGVVKKYADGGEASAPTSDFDPARGMTGMSRDAMMYLYGLMPESSAEREYPELPTIEFRPRATGTAAPIQPSKASDSFGAEPLDVRYSDPRNFQPFGGMMGPTGPAGGSLYNWSSQDGFYNHDAGGFMGSPFAEGGLASLAKGGMKAGGFVVPADVVSMAGEGNTDAGYDRIKRMLPGATPIKGKDGGQADTVKTSIEGKQPARVAHGEMYVPPKTVEGAGGAKKLYAMMDNIRKQATGNKKQIKPVNIKKALA
jgi:hypothetical protein